MTYLIDEQLIILKTIDLKISYFTSICQVYLNNYLKMMEKKVFYNIVFRMDFISGWEYKFKIGLCDSL